MNDGDYLGKARAVLLSDSSVQSLVGRRVYLFERGRSKGDSGNQPAIVISHVSETSERTLDGYATRQGRVSVVCWALKYSAAIAVSKQVSNALNDYQGIPIEGKKPVRFWLDNATHLINDGGDVGNTGGKQAFAISMDFMVKELA